MESQTSWKTIAKIVEASYRAIENVKSGMTTDEACAILVKDVELVLLSFILPVEETACQEEAQSDHISQERPKSENL
jgi:hypothetical protein